MTDISVSLSPYHSGVMQGSMRCDALSLMDTPEALRVWTILHPDTADGFPGASPQSEIPRVPPEPPEPPAVWAKSPAQTPPQNFPQVFGASGGVGVRRVPPGSFRGQERHG